HKPSEFVELYEEGGLTSASFVLEKGFGENTNSGIWLFPEEVLYLAEKNKVLVKKKSKITLESVRRYLSKNNEGFMQRYFVYRDLRDKGFVVKAGSKYGADFRIYDKGVKPTKGAREHSKYLIWVLSEDDFLEMKNLIGINRVSHSVKKRLLLAIIDKENDVTYLQLARTLL
ncbi:MAG: tRNA-intron lyase, partial [Candidatus Altiarchaeota archaeon]|nr:tRNA-intron lyase [Candidatus Altiarchaeota archaeon]